VNNDDNIHKTTKRPTPPPRRNVELGKTLTNEKVFISEAMRFSLEKEKEALRFPMKRRNELVVGLEKIDRTAKMGSYEKETANKINGGSEPALTTHETVEEGFTKNHVLPDSTQKQLEPGTGIKNVGLHPKTLFNPGRKRGGPRKLASRKKMTTDVPGEKRNFARKPAHAEDENTGLWTKVQRVYVWNTSRPPGKGKKRAKGPGGAGEQPQTEIIAKVG